jgi:hypothetical protein
MVQQDGRSVVTEIGDSIRHLFEPDEKLLKQNPHGFVLGACL